MSAIAAIPSYRRPNSFARRSGKDGALLLFFDVETVEDDCAELWQQEKEEADAKGEEFKTALSPECCRVVSLAWAIDDGPVESAVGGLPRA